MLSRSSYLLARGGTTLRSLETAYQSTSRVIDKRYEECFMRSYAIERSPQQTAAPNPQQPVVEEDFQGTKQKQKALYESMVAEVSGVAEDVRVLDEESTSLGKMARDPRGPENDRVKAAREKATSTERELEDSNMEDAVFDDTKSTADAMEETTFAEQMNRTPGTATKPK